MRDSIGDGQRAKGKGLDAKVAKRGAEVRDVRQMGWLQIVSPIHDDDRVMDGAVSAGRIAGPWGLKAGLVGGYGYGFLGCFGYVVLGLPVADGGADGVFCQD